MRASKPRVAGRRRLRDRQRVDGRGPIESAERVRSSGSRRPAARGIRWRAILERKEELADELEADWFMHLDCDEMRLPPRPKRPSRRRSPSSTRWGTTRSNFNEFTFIPTQEAPDHDHPRFQETMRHYYAIRRGRPDRLNAWKRQDASRRARGERRSSGLLPGATLVPAHVPDEALPVPERRACSLEVRRARVRPDRGRVGLAPAASGTLRRGRHALLPQAALRETLLRRRPRCLRTPGARHPALRPFPMSKGPSGGGRDRSPRFPETAASAWERLSWVLGFRRIGYEVDVGGSTSGRGHCVASAKSALHCRGIPTPPRHPVVRERRPAVRGLTGSVSLIGDAGESLSGFFPLRAVLEMAGDAATSSSTPEATYGTSRSSSVHAGRCTSTWTRLPVARLACGMLGAARRGSRPPLPRSARTSGTPASDLPTAGIEWKHTRQPVVLEEWPFADEVAEASLHDRRTLARNRPARGSRTTSAHPPRKGDELEALCSTFPNEPASPLRSRSTRAATTCLAGCSRAPRVDRRRARLLVAADPDSFRSYVQGSWAEFSVAKGAYVETSSGWSSERTARYLASGPAGARTGHGLFADAARREGLLAFRTLEEAVEGAQQIAADYEATGGQRDPSPRSYFDSESSLPACSRTPPVSRAICVLGLMCTGTSAVAGVLELLGVYFGPPERLLEPNVANPTGFRRAQGSLHLNNELLGRLGGTWYAPPALQGGLGTIPKPTTCASAPARWSSRISPRTTSGRGMTRAPVSRCPFWAGLVPGSPPRCLPSGARRDRAVVRGAGRAGLDGCPQRLVRPVRDGPRSVAAVYGRCPRAERTNRARTHRFYDERRSPLGQSAASAAFTDLSRGPTPDRATADPKRSCGNLRFGISGLERRPASIRRSRSTPDFERTRLDPKSNIRG